MDDYARAAMTDLQYNNALPQYSDLKLAMQKPGGADYLRAAFDIANSKDAYDMNNRGNNLRREAEMHGALWTRKNLIGNLVNV